jgi:hypothetical protein
MSMSDHRRILDQKAEELRKKHQEEYKKAREALNEALKDRNAQIIVRHLAKICGFFQSSVVVDPSTREVNLNSVVYNEGRRSVYLDLRRMMSDDLRRAVESKGETTNDQQGE